MIPKKVTDEITHWINEGRYGSLQINFQGGKIVNMNLNQSVKVESIGIAVGIVKVTASQEVKVD